MQKQHRLAGWFAHGPVMQEHFRHDVTGVKLEVPRYPIAFLRSGIIASYAAFENRTTVDAATAKVALRMMSPEQVEDERGLQETG